VARFPILLGLGRERLEQGIPAPQNSAYFEDPCLCDLDAPARLLAGVGIIRGAGDPIGLRDHAGVAVRLDATADRLAEWRSLSCRERAVQKEPQVLVAG